MATVTQVPPGIRIALATTNRHKAREVAEILRPFGIEIDVPESLPTVVETGITFEENAILKAASAAATLGRPALAEDSGIVVEALDGAPGIYSARYAGPGADDLANRTKLLDEIAKRRLVDPKAAFVCAAVVVDPSGKVRFEATGRVEGVVRGPARGTHGFGYDPIFHHVSARHPAPGVRFSELSAEEKNEISHRGIALRALATQLRRASEPA